MFSMERAAVFAATVANHVNLVAFVVDLFVGVIVSVVVVFVVVVVVIVYRYVPAVAAPPPEVEATPA